MSEVWFMPWLGLDDELDIGPVAIWPWSENEMRIANDQARSDVSARLKQYVDNAGKSVDTISILSIGHIDCRDLTPSEKKMIHRAGDILLFSTITEGLFQSIRRNNGGFGTPTTERFLLYGQPFQAGTPFVSIGTRTTGQCWPVSMIRFYRPLEMGGTSMNRNGIFLDALGKMLETASTTSTANRIFDALESFRLANSDNAELVSTRLRILSMQTAIEIALGGGESKQELGEKLDILCADPQLRRQTKTRIGKRGKIISTGFSELVWGFVDFYDLRSSIVHGNEIRPTEFDFVITSGTNLGQLNMSIMLFREIVARLLHKEGFIDSSAMSSMGLQTIHTALGWAI